MSCIMFWTNNFLLLPKVPAGAFFVLRWNFPLPGAPLSQKKANSNVEYRSSSWAGFLSVEPLKMSWQMLTVVLSNPSSYWHYAFSLGDIHSVFLLLHNWATAINWHFGDEEKNSLTSFFLLVVTQGLLAMGVEEKLHCVSFFPAGHLCSHGPCLTALATDLWYESYGKILLLCSLKCWANILLGFW